MPIIPVSSVYAVLITFVMLYLAFCVTNSPPINDKKRQTVLSNTLISSHSLFKWLSFISLLFIVLSELNGATRFLLHFAGVSTLIASGLFSVTINLNETQQHKLTTSLYFWQTSNCTFTGILNLYLCWPYFF